MNSKVFGEYLIAIAWVLFCIGLVACAAVFCVITVSFAAMLVPDFFAAMVRAFT